MSKGQSYSIDRIGDSTVPVRIWLDDAIFADGSTMGSIEAIQAQWDRRLWLVAGFNEVFRHIDVDAAGITDKGQLVELLTRFRDARLTPGLAHEERGSVKTAHNTVIDNLRGLSTKPAAAVIASIRTREAARAKAIEAEVVPAGVRPQLPQQ